MTLESPRIPGSGSFGRVSLWGSIKLKFMCLTHTPALPEAWPGKEQPRPHRDNMLHSYGAESVAFGWLSLTLWQLSFYSCRRKLCGHNARTRPKRPTENTTCQGPQCGKSSQYVCTKCVTWRQFSPSHSSWLWHCPFCKIKSLNVLGKRGGTDCVTLGTWFLVSYLQTPRQRSVC